jgi:hypothetical protein
VSVRFGCYRYWAAAGYVVLQVKILDVTGCALLHLNQTGIEGVCGDAYEYGYWDGAGCAVPHMSKLGCYKECVVLHMNFLSCYRVSR